MHLVPWWARLDPSLSLESGPSPGVSPSRAVGLMWQLRAPGASVSGGRKWKLLKAWKLPVCSIGQIHHRAQLDARGGDSDIPTGGVSQNFLPPVSITDQACLSPKLWRLTCVSTFWHVLLFSLWSPHFRRPRNLQTSESGRQGGTASPGEPTPLMAPLFPSPSLFTVQA